MVPIRLAEVGEREEALAELQIRLGEATEAQASMGLSETCKKLARESAGIVRRGCAGAGHLEDHDFEACGVLTEAWDSHID